VAAREHEFESASARLAEQRDCALVKTAVVFNLPKDLLGISLAVQAKKNLPDKILLVLAEAPTDAGVANVPVVVHCRAVYHDILEFSSRVLDAR